MQITEQIIERIARKVFNTMFSPALRQSNVVMGGSGSSVSWADNAGHANSADTAAAAASVPWSGVTSKPHIPSVSAAVNNSTLTITIDGTAYSLTDTNTWRPVVDNLTSTDTDKSLSANQGKALKGFIDTLTSYFDANGNAKSALKLTTVSKTAWGKTFWTNGGVPTSISGDMTSVGDISFATSGKNIGGVAYFDTVNKRLGIGQSSPSYALDVNGGAGFSGNVLPNADYATTAYNLGSSSYRWGAVYANRLIAYSTTDAEAGAANAVALITGAPQGYHLEMDGNEIMAKSDGTHSSPLYLNAEGGDVVINEKSGNCGIGTTSPAYKLDVNGVIYSNTGVYSAGYVTALSDARKKDVLGDVELSAEQIAEMPAVRFSWTDKTKPGIFIGTLAQPWQKLLPEAVRTMADGVLSFDYQSAAMVSVINLAREVAALKSKLKRYGFK